MSNGVEVKKGTLVGRARRSSEEVEKKLFDRVCLTTQLYLLFDYIRPQFYLRILDIVKPGLLLTVLSIFSWSRQKDKRALKHPLIKRYFLFVFLSLLSLLWCVNHYWVVMQSRNLLIFMFAGTLPVSLVVSNKEKVKGFIYFWLFLHAIIAIVCIVNKGVGPGGALADENDFALCMVMPISYAVFLAMSRISTKKQRLVLIGLVLLLTLAVAATLSRGGMVGYAAVIAVIIFFSKKKLRMLLVLVVLMVASIPFLPSTFFSEASSIENTQDSTRIDRLRSWQMGWLMFLDSPIVGVGTANFPFRVHEYEQQMPDYDPNGGNHAGRVAHSMWFTLIPEYGLVGTSAYLWIVFGVINRCRKIARLSEDSSDDQVEMYSIVAKGTLGALIGYMVSGTFIAVLYYPHFWYLIGVCVGLDIGFHDIYAPPKKRVLAR